jgi:hypothetical protein
MTCALEADEAGVMQKMASAITASARFTIRIPLDHYAQVSGVKIRRATASQSRSFESAGRSAASSNNCR